MFTMRRRHLLTSLAASTAAAAAAAQKPAWSNPATKALFDSFRLHWVDTKEYTLSMLEAMPADSFDFKAHPTQRTFGDQLNHLAWANLAYFRAFNLIPADADKLPKNYKDVVKEYPISDKEAVRKFVTATFDYTLAALDKMSEKDMLRTDVKPWSNAAFHSTTDMFFRAYMHTAHHRGQIVTYLRVKGLVPPAWKFEPHA